MENIQQFQRVLELPKIERPQKWNKGIMAFTGFRGHSTPATNIGSRIAHIERYELFHHSSLCYVVTADSDKTSVEKALPYQCILRQAPLFKKKFLGDIETEGPVRKIIEFKQAGPEIGFGDKVGEAAKACSKILPTSKRMIGRIKTLKSNYEFNAEIRLRAIACNGATKIYETALDYLDKSAPDYNIMILIVDPNRGVSRFKSNFALQELYRNRKNTIVIVCDVGSGDVKKLDYAALRFIAAMVNKSPFPLAMDPSDTITWFLDNGNGYIEIDFREIDLDVSKTSRNWKIGPIRLGRNTLTPRNDMTSTAAAAIDMLEELAEDTRGDGRKHLYVLYGPVDSETFEKVHFRAQELGVELACLPAETPKTFDEKYNITQFKLYLIRASTGWQSIRCIDKLYGLAPRQNAEEVVPSQVLEASFEEDGTLKGALDRLGNGLGARKDWYVPRGSTA